MGTLANKGLGSPAAAAACCTSASVRPLARILVCWRSQAIHWPAYCRGTDPAKEVFNTLDAGTPTSSVKPLPSATASTSFLVQWSGQDDAGGSGIANYDVYVADNGGPFVLWLDRTALTQATFTGRNGHSYAFYTRARDNVGQLEAAPAVADAVTLVVIVTAPPTVQSVVLNDGSAQRSMLSSITITFSGPVILPANPADAFELVKQGGSRVGLNVAVSLVAGKTVAVLTFTGPDIIGRSLADGNYTLTIHGDKIRDGSDQNLDGDANGTAGGNRVDAFFRLFGDSDGNGVVDDVDFWPIIRAFGKRSGDPGFLSYFDYDGNGVIDLPVDYTQFSLRFGQRI